MKPIQVRVSGKVPAQVKQPPAKAKAKSSEPAQGGFDLQEFLDQMNKKFGTGSVIRASEAIGLKLKYLSTGCARLDLALGGGWPQNRMTEMFGSESAGKTTLVLKTIAKFQQSYPQGVAVLIDLERSFDPVYCKALHIDLGKLIVISPDQGEQASDMLDEVLKLNVDLFIAVDSIAAMTPTVTVENSAQKAGVGDHPRLINKVFARCNARMKRNLVDKDAPTVTVVFLNQEREKVGMLFGDPSCFQYNSAVVLADGSTEKIGKIVTQKLPLEVLSHDPETNRIVPRKIVGWVNKGRAEQGEFVKLVAGRAGGNGRTRMLVTRNHWVFTNNGEKQVGSLDITKDQLLVLGYRRLNSVQRDIAVGSGLMGDAHLGASHQSKTSCCYRLRFAQGPSQYAYLAWKHRLMGKLALDYYSKEDGVSMFETRPFSDLTELRRTCYVGGKRIVSKELLEALNLRSFAIWYMDDGTFGFETATGYPRASISCQKYTDAERNMLADRLVELGLPRPVVCSRRLSWNGGVIAEVHALIAEYIPKCMQYKLLPRFRGKYVAIKEKDVKAERMLVPAPIVSIEGAKPRRAMNKFDLTIEGTHSYFVDGGLVHNTTPGGKGKNFFSSVRLKLFTSGATAKKVIEAVTRNGVTRQVTIAKITSFQVVKNKAGGKPFEEGEFTYYITPTSVHRQFEYDDAEALFAAGRFYGHIKTTPMGFNFDGGAVGPFKKESAFISKLASSAHVMNKLLAQCLQSVREEDPMSQLEDSDGCAISGES